MRCDTRFRAVESWSVSTGRSVGELFFGWLWYDSSGFIPLNRRLLSDLRFWGWEFDSDRSVACIRRGGIVPRVGKSARKNQNPAPSTSNQVEEQEFLDYDKDGETDGEVVLDEPFNANWSRDLMCVADPFIDTKVSRHPLSQCAHSALVHYRIVLVRSKSSSLLGSSMSAETPRACCDWEYLSNRFYRGSFHLGRPARYVRGISRERRDKRTKTGADSRQRLGLDPNHGPNPGLLVLG